MTTAAQPDLNALPNYSDRVPFLPYGENAYKATCEKLFFHDGYHGKAYCLYLRVTESTTAQAPVGVQHCIRFPILDDRKRADMKMQDFRCVLASMCGVPAAEGFDVNGARDTFIAMGEALAAENIAISIVSKNATSKKDPSKVYTNFRYYPAT